MKNQIGYTKSNEIIKSMIHQGCLLHSMNYFDINFCRENNADLAFGKMIIDCELHFRLYKLDNPDSGFIKLNNAYWYKFNIESICTRYTLFTKDKVIRLLIELIDKGYYKVKGNITEEEEILILLEE